MSTDAPLSETGRGAVSPRRCQALVAALLFGLWGCSSHRDHSADAMARGANAEPRTRLVLKMQPLWGDLGPFRSLLRGFSREHPDVDVTVELIPNASDVAHQYYLTALESGASDFHVLVMDVVWAAEFARAGWVADLSVAFPPDRMREDFLPGSVAAVVIDGRTYAVPWFADVGLLYYRKDLVPRAPRTYRELLTFAKDAMARARSRSHDSPELYGYVFQGRQYEGLTCNVYEAIWGHRGDALRHGRLLLDRPEVHDALVYLRGLVASGVSPPSVTSAGEEEARRLFQEGRAVFMRNWPYAFAELEGEQSKVKGRVGVAPLPTLHGEPGAGTLGGSLLAINRHASRSHRRAAEQLVTHLTSIEANLLMARHYARNPARRDAYDSPRLAADAPFILGLLPALLRARPRPVTPYYVMLADILQSEFSGAVSGVRSPQAAMQRAQRLSDHLLRGAP